MKVVTKPSASPVTLAEVKQRLRIDTADEDGLLARYIQGAIARIDGPAGIGYALSEQTWRLSLDHFPSVIKLPGAPVQSVTSVKYIDAAGTEQTMAPADYRVDVAGEPARITPVFGGSWPSPRDVTGAVTVDYVLGGDPPDDLIDAVCLLVGHRYENREAVGMNNAAEIPMGFKSIVAEYRQGGIVA